MSSTPEPKQLGRVVQSQQQWEELYDLYIHTLISAALIWQINKC